MRPDEGGVPQLLALGEEESPPLAGISGVSLESQGWAQQVKRRERKRYDLLIKRGAKGIWAHQRFLPVHLLPTWQVRSFAGTPPVTAADTRGHLLWE